jgi:hypothetical protein
MFGWEIVRQMVATKELQSSTWKSDQRSLLAIINKAQSWDIDPTDACRASLSSLRVIIRRAKFAIRRNSMAELEELFRWAANLALSDLVLKLGRSEIEQITAVVEPTRTEPRVLLWVTRAQFERIKKSTKLYFAFNEEVPGENVA